MQRRRFLLMACTVASMNAAPAHATITDFFARLRLPGSGIPAAPQSISTQPVRKVYLNGFPLNILVGLTRESTTQILDHYTNHLLRTNAPEGGKLQPVVLRRKGTAQGYLLLVNPGEPGRLPQDAELPEILATSPLRLVYTQSFLGHTNYLAVWSDTPMPVATLQPPEGSDAPGQDLPSVPRPRGRRTLSILEPASGYSLLTYEVREKPEIALRETTMRLLGSGFQEDRAFSVGRELLEKSGEAGNEEGMLARFQRGTRELMVSVKPGSDAAGAMVTYISRDR